MADLLVANKATGQLSAGINTTATSLTLKTGEGAKFPSPTGNQYFYAVLQKSDGNWEIVKCTARSGDTFSTIVRNVESSTGSAQSFSTDDIVSLRPVKQDIQDILAGQDSILSTQTSHIAATGQSVHGLGNFLKGYVQRSVFEYKDSDEIYIGGGIYHVKDVMVFINSKLTSPAISSGGTDWHYLYIDYSAVPSNGIIDNSDIYWSTNEPTFNQSLKGWYHPTDTDDRCIFAVHTDTNNIDRFLHSGDRLVFYDWYNIGWDLQSQDIDTSWVDVTLTAPKFSTHMQITAKGDRTDGKKYFKWRQNGLTTSGHYLVIVVNSEEEAYNTTTVISDSNQKIEVCSGYSGGTTLSIFTEGFYLPAGL